MRRWSEVAERVAATTRTSEKTALLADYFAGLTRRRAADRGRLPDRPAVRRGRPAGRRPRLVGDRDDRHRPRRRPASRARRGLRPLVGPRPGGRRRPDRRRPRPGPGDDADAARGRGGLRRDRGRRPGRRPRAAILRDLLARSDPLTAKYIVKVLSGELRIGLREGLVEAAIAKAFDRPLDAVKWAGMLTGDIGRMAELARDDRLDEASLALFHPIKFMLASPAEDAAEIVKRLGVAGLGRGQVRRDPGPAPPRTATTSGSTRATSTTSAASSPRSSRAPAGWPGTASSTARSSPGATAPCCRSSRSRPGSGGSRRRRRSGRRCR